MFYGPGAGKLPTASAVAGDLIDVMGHTPAGIHTPVWVDATPDEIADPADYACRHLVVLDVQESDAGHLKTVFGGLNAVRCTEGRFSFITEEMSESAVKDCIEAAGYPLISRIRVL
jgi:homoserine dehydrogenase